VYVQRYYEKAVDCCFSTVVTILLFLSIYTDLIDFANTNNLIMPGGAPVHGLYDAALERRQQLMGSSGPAALVKNFRVFSIALFACIGGLLYVNKALSLKIDYNTCMRLRQVLITFFIMIGI
jgi:hypothetical protein